MRVLRGLSGRVLPCGCLVGVYETYGGGVVSTIDAVGRDCTQPDHELHKTVNADPDSVAASNLDATPTSRV